MPSRGILIVALLAAFFGAPSPASAADNELTAPGVSPGVGSTSTVVTFSVRYEGKFAATSVTATVASLTLPMGLVGGTALSGTWVAASGLPAGSWPVTVVALADGGNASTPAGPTVTVSAPNAPLPPTPSVAPGQPGGRRGLAAPGTPGENPQATTGGGPSSAGSGVTAPAGAQREENGSEGGPVEDGLLQAVLLMGLAGVAAVALIGTAMLFAGRRRQREEEEPLAAAAADRTAAHLDHRSLRRARLTRMGEDPIIAALGIDSGDARRHRRRASQASSEPGERETGSRWTLEGGAPGPLERGHVNRHGAARHHDRQP